MIPHVKTNPDWEYIDEWFKKRAAEAGHSIYGHTETVEGYVIDQVVADAARELGVSAAKTIVKMIDDPDAI